MFQEQEAACRTHAKRESRNLPQRIHEPLLHPLLLESPSVSRFAEDGGSAVTCGHDERVLRVETERAILPSADCSRGYGQGRLWGRGKRITGNEAQVVSREGLVLGDGRFDRRLRLGFRLHLVRHGLQLGLAGRLGERSGVASTWWESWVEGAERSADGCCRHVALAVDEGEGGLRLR